MTIPYPRRIPLQYAFGFAMALGVGLMGEGNPVGMCLALMAIVLVGTVGFNEGGGFNSPTGAYVFFVVMFTSLVGATTKLVTNEPLTDFVSNADETLDVYLAGTIAMTCAVFVSNRMKRRKPILKGRLTFENAPRVVAGCLVFAFALPLVLQTLFPGGAGGLGTILAQINIALPLCVTIGVYAKTRQTNGRSSFNWPSFIAFAYSTYVGLIGFSKEGIFGSAAAWIVAAAAGGLRVSRTKAAVLLVSAIASVLILVPFSQYGRNYRLSYGANPEKALELLTHPLQTRDLANAAEAALPPELYHWYSKPRGILDRWTLVPIDSALIRATDITGEIGYTNAGNYLLNVLPHFLFPNKPVLSTGNQYAHEIGMLAPDDFTTGISFSPYAEAYHMGGWLGVAFLLPALMLLMFVALQWVVGDLDDSPWGLFFIAYFAHGGAEGSLQTPVRMASVGVEAILACAFLMIYVTPILGKLLVRAAKPKRALSVAPIPGVVRRPA